MVVKELFETQENGTKLYRTYSDKNLKIKQIETGIVYDEAVDIESAKYGYEEIEENIEKDTNEIELKAQAYDILIGEVE